MQGGLRHSLVHAMYDAMYDANMLSVAYAYTIIYIGVVLCNCITIIVTFSSHAINITTCNATFKSC